MEDAFEEFSDIRLPSDPIPITYNAAPQSVQPIVRLSPETGDLEVVMARWGLIPFWSKDAKIGYSTFNARSEELETRPAFREALKSRRCLVPVNCFYEWQKLGPKEKRPFAIGMSDDRPFAFGGLWDRWRSPEGTVVESFTINTVAPNTLVEPIHTRMPAIVERGDYLRWLRVSDDWRQFLQPFAAEKMRCWVVDKAVGNVRNDRADLIIETVYAPQTQATMF